MLKFQPEISMNDEWKEIPSTDGKYEATADGLIRNTQSGKLVPIFVNARGYKFVRIYPRGVGGKCVCVHTPVAAAFIGPNPGKLEVNHKDGNKLNNHPDNLEYVTRGENQRHAYSIGLRHATRGELNGKGLLTQEKVREILKLRSDFGYGARKIAKIIGLPDHPSAVGRVLSGHIWKHIQAVST